MLSWLLSTPLALTILKWAAVAMGIGAVLLGARLGGRHAERIERAEGAQLAAKDRIKTDAHLGSVSDVVLDAYLRPPSRR